MADKSNKKFWEKTAKLYTYFQEKGNEELYKTIYEKIKPFFNKEQRVLELACGTGQLTRLLSDETDSWTATDFSEKMVYETEKRLNNQNVIYEVQDATALGYKNDVFDVVLIANALHIMPNPNKALDKIKRVLKTDGLLIAPTFVYDGKVNKIRLWFMEKAGFKTFNKWKSEDYINFIEDNGFKIKEKYLVQGKLLSECVLVCVKIDSKVK
ncbi:class I SAM-dependent methyltransferase [Anaerofustis stercorihominis]|uniref:Class I SAM-dependent methyltransferase n=1 Tax=Anaerofustis stercorihominis TaxID=214853 RepID=A0A3E3DZE8_9FIRM|nr:class I SAM-dependent methyltransferase [Anaerofustis stercorihominis]RGD74455.1 class I SAM-dependent methyltransferase [Anaerofustis stercorihominis]